MRTSYSTMALKVTPFAEYEGAKVEGMEEARGAAVSIHGCFDQS